MSTQNPDPVDWGVDRVVDFLCNPQEAPWSDSATSSRPNLPALEAALRDNEINGEALLYDVDREALRDDMGIKALGHRSSVLRAIDWLRARSPKYQASKQIFPSLNHPHPTEHPSLSVNSPIITSAEPPSRIPSIPAFLAPSVPTEMTPAPAATGMKQKRRIAPTLVNDFTGQKLGGNEVQQGQMSAENQATALSLQPISQHSESNTAHDEGSQKVSLSEASEANMIPTDTADLELKLSKDRSSELTQKDHEFFAQLLLKHPVGGDVVPLLGESDDEYDEETQNELEEDELDSMSPISSTDCEAIFSEFIDNHEKAWMAKYLPKHRPYAQLVWNQARNPRSGMDYKSGALRTLENLRLRLIKQKTALRDAKYKSRISLRDACRVMETTLDQICFEEWRIQTMELDTCPPFVPPLPKISRPRRQRVAEADEESLGSDSDLAADDEASAADSDPDFVDDDNIPHRPREGLLGSTPAGSGLVDLTSDDSEEVPVAKKRRRTMENQRRIEGEIKVNASKPGPFAEFESGEKYHLSSSDQFSPPGALRLDSSPQPLESDADDMMVETPPLNPALPASSPQDVDMDDDFLVKTPPLNPINLPKPSGKLRLSQSSPETPTNITESTALRLHKKSTLRAVSLEKDTSDAVSPSMDDIDIFDMVSVMSWEKIEASKNPVWLLAKHLIGLPPDEKQQFGPYLENYVDAVYMEEVTAALQAMLKNSWNLDGRTEEESKPAMRLGAYFVSWSSGQALNPRGMGREPLQKALEAIEEYDDLSEFIHFLHRLKKLHASFRAWLSRQPSRKEKEGHSTYSESADSDSNLLKRKRYPKGHSKKKPFGPRPLSNMQKDAQARQAKQDKDRERLRMARESKGLSNSDPEGQAVTFKEPVIYLHPQLGRYVKPHQLTGIQFMWRELIEADNQQGCLLAHTMGLGKSMQVISLLVTIAAAAASDDPKIRRQVPERFHRSQTLVLCPSSVVPNWSDEFAMWTPIDHHLGPIQIIAPRGKALEMPERLQTIRNWNRRGGVLIMSYEMLRILIVNKPVRLTEEEHKLVEDCLLSGPNIIVADEAHKLRSGKSAISQVASRFKSTSRIALTGSPLSNQLFEYYQMVEWVAPGYLEDPNTFKKKFMDPIQAGSYLDSTLMEQRDSLVSLQLLNGILAPKVLRADTSVLAADLPSKTEFVLTVPLTELQRNAYNTFVDCAQSGGTDASLKLWSWLAIMQLLCNHPFPFREKLADRLKQQEDNEISILPTSIQDAGLPSDLFSKMDALFSKYPNLEETSLSNRAVILDKILDLSMQAKDKILIFTQSIPTMNFLDLMLKNKGRRYLRIDGNTTGPDRQYATKRFNSDSSEKILLISTRAGGVGLNMFGANRVVIFDFLFNPMWEEQAVGRAYRLGQKKPVYVYRFVAGGTFEELIFNNAVFKRQLAVRVVDKKTVVRESKKKTSSYLKHVKGVEKEEHYPALGRDPQVLDHILGGELGEIILKAKLSHIQDNENDHLTEEEARQVEYELRMERLKRSDPLAYHAELKRQDDAEKIHQQEMSRMMKQREAEKAAEQQRLFQMSQAAQQREFMMDQQRLASLKRGPIPMSMVGKSPLSVNKRGGAGAAQPARFLSGANATPIAKDRPQLHAYQTISSFQPPGIKEQPTPPSAHPPSSSTLRQADAGDSRRAFEVPPGNEVIVIEDSSVPLTPVEAPGNSLPQQSAPAGSSPVSLTPNVRGDVAQENAIRATHADMPPPSIHNEQGSAGHIEDSNTANSGDGPVDPIDKNTVETARNQATEPHRLAAVDQKSSDAGDNDISAPNVPGLGMADEISALKPSASGCTAISEGRHMGLGDDPGSKMAAVGASPNVPATVTASGQSETMDTNDSSGVTVIAPAAGAAIGLTMSSQFGPRDINDGA
ncbi:Protein CHROMATIN REMODELING 20 [Penicillium rolfsii]|nr:Protein CHROMATIN REMODELING 20 [Penicillium rolfsii]